MKRLPFWVEWWLEAFAGLVILVLVGAVATFMICVAGHYVKAALDALGM